MTHITGMLDEYPCYLVENINEKSITIFTAFHALLDDYISEKRKSGNIYNEKSS